MTNQKTTYDNEKAEGVLAHDLYNSKIIRTSIAGGGIACQITFSDEIILVAVLHT